MEATLLFSVIIGLLAAALFAYVGFRLGRRVVQTPEARAAFTCFRVWWYAAALALLASPIRSLLHMLGVLEPWLYQATSSFTLVVACIGLWALLCNLLYLYTGSTRWWGAVAGFYLVAAFYLLGLNAWTGPPTGIIEDGWNIEAIRDREPPAALRLGALFGILLPQLLAAILYLRLRRWAPGPTQRYRIVMVASSILILVGVTLVATLLRLEGAAEALIEGGVRILSALMALFAYEPPRAVQRRLGVQRAGEEDRPARPSAS